jgi:hypothetical protein
MAGPAIRRYQCAAHKGLLADWCCARYDFCDERVLPENSLPLH